MKLLDTLQRYDTLVFTRLLKIRLHEPLRRIFQPISKTGDGHAYPIAVLAVAGEAGLQHGFVQAVLMAFLFERPLYFLLKNTLKRNRPQQALRNFKSFIVPHDKFSFPSGHTSAAFLMATLAAAFWPMLLIPMFLWAAGVGFSRVLLGVHFPSDVVVGATMGMSMATLSLQWMNL